jgi:hypothetical protein
MMFYLMHDDEETQKKGTVILVFHLGAFQFSATKLAEVAIGDRINTDVPVRVSSVHALIGEASASYGHCISIFLKFADAEAKARVKLHFGTYRRAKGCFTFFESRYVRVSLGVLFCLL